MRRIGNILVQQGLLKAEGQKVVQTKTKNTWLDARESPGLPAWPLPIELAQEAASTAHGEFL